MVGTFTNGSSGFKRVPTLKDPDFVSYKYASSPLKLKENAVSLSDKLVTWSVALSRAFDEAAHSVYDGEYAAHHYNETYSWYWALKDWCRGFAEGMRITGTPAPSQHNESSQLNR